MFKCFILFITRNQEWLMLVNNHKKLDNNSNILPSQNQFLFSQKCSQSMHKFEYDDAQLTYNYENKSKGGVPTSQKHPLLLFGLQLGRQIAPNPQKHLGIS